MRWYFHALRGGVLWACLLPALLCLLCARGQAAEDTPPPVKDSAVDTIQETLTRERELYVEYGEKEKSILGQLSLLEKAIAEKRHFIQDIQERRKGVKEDLEVLQGTLEETERARRDIEDRLVDRLVAFYKHAKRGAIHVLTTASGFHELTKRIKYLHFLIGDDRKLLDQMAAVQARHETALARKKQKFAAVERLRKEEDERLASLKKDLDSRVLLLMKVHQEKEFYETAVTELELAAKGLGNTIRDLEESTDKQDEAAPLPTGFAGNKGRLHPPIEGKIIRNYSPFGGKGGTGQKGVYIEGRPGAEVRAVFDGRVDYSGWLKGYGQIVILNHGDRYFSVSAHLQRRDREKGDAVQAGEVIGLLGDTESLVGPRLYFELRNGAENLDPPAWLKGL